jgi:chlorobactene glucosyltransferase
LFLILLWNLYILRRKKPPKVVDKLLPSVSVLIPARNEELNIYNILVSLLEQDYPAYEVIVLNDNSEDKTGEIISGLAQKYSKLKVLQGKPLEKGWTGKSFACTQLFEASKGEIIIFTDADTIHNKDSIRNSVELALFREADMLTLMPQFTMVSLAEKIMMPMLMFTANLLLPLYFVDKKGFTKFSIGVGPFMLFRRSAYKKIGGHGSVKNALVEDVWLAREIKQKRLKLVVEDGKEILSVRMYRNFREIWDGFSKNIFAGFKFSSFSLFSVNLMYFLLFFLPFLLLIIELLLPFGSKFNLFLLIFQVFLLYLARMLLAFRFRLGYVSVLLHPLGALSVPVIALNSWRWIVSGKGAKWKGRTYDPKAG